MTALLDYRTRCTTAQIQREINAVQRLIDAQARAADLADREAERHYPGQDVPAARRRAAQLRAGLVPLHCRLHALQARLPDPETLSKERMAALISSLGDEAVERGRRLLAPAKPKPAWRRRSVDLFAALSR